MGNATPYANKKMGSLQRQQNSFNNHETRYMYVTINRCGHLYTKIPYSKHCLHWIQISCHSVTVSLTHQRISIQPTSIQ